MAILHPDALHPESNQLVTLYGLGRELLKLDHVAYEAYPCGRCINARRTLAFVYIGPIC
jgi:hypothetical protein